MADRGIGLWPAIAWAEGFLLLGLAGVGLAAVSSTPLCDSLLHGCPPGESAVGADTIVWLVASGVILLALLTLPAMGAVESALGSTEA